MTIKKTKKPMAALLALLLMLMTVMTDLSPVYAAQGKQLTQKQSDGWLESAYVEWKTMDHVDGYTAYVKKAEESDDTYTKLDNELIRNYGDYYRADAVGLAKGSYTMKVVPVVTGNEQEDLAMVTEALQVSEHVREGFAFSKNSKMGTGSGGYTDQGTMPSNAQVIYLTGKTADTVTLDVIVDAKGKKQTCTGIVNILAARQKGYDKTPLIIRLIGTVNSSDITGLNSSGYLQLKGCYNVTLEGIGEDATINGWGVLVRDAHNAEIRNLGVKLFPDDGISLDTDNENIWIHNNDLFYGTAGGDADQAKGDGSLDVKSSTYVTVSYNHFWDSGKSSLCGMKDTDEFFVTYHHNWFDHSDSRHPRIRVGTIHIYNNYFDGNAKYGVGVTKGSSAFVEANAFRNCNYPMLTSLQGSDVYGSNQGTFSGEPGGMIKAFNNKIEGAKRVVYANEDATQFDAYLAETREEQVPSTYKTVSGENTYNNFDTNKEVMYDYAPLQPEQVVGNVTKYAGRINGGDLKFTFNNEVDDTSYSINQELMAAVRNYKTTLVSVGGVGSVTTEPTEQPTVAPTTVPTTAPGTEATAVPTQAPVTGGVITHNFTTDGVTSAVFKFPGVSNLSTSKGSVEYNGMNLTQCLKFETGTKITFTAPADGTLTLVFNPTTGKVNVKVNGEKVTGDSATGILSVPVTSGTTYELDKADSANLFYMSVTAAGEETTPEVTGTPEATETPEVTGTPEATETPEETQTPEVTQAPEETEAPTPSTIPTPPANQVEGDLYVAPNAAGTGTWEDPMAFTNALTEVKEGNTIWMLPGTYSYSEMIVIADTNNGTKDAYKQVRRYGTDSVVLDFSTQEYTSANRGVVQDGDYWHWYGIEFKGAGDNGMLLSGNNNILELCQFYENRDTGLQISRYNTAAATIDLWPSNNLIKNCTSFNNCDSSGENADGFAAKLTCGEGNVFDGCMSYNNSDDGWDLYAKTATGPIGVVTIKNCIAFRNGKLTTGAGSAGGDMNGFKLGGSGVGTPHIVENCMAFENGAHGFTDNNNPTALQFSNITSFNNAVYSTSKANFQIDRANNPSVINALGISTRKIGSDKIVGAEGASILYSNSGKYYEYQGTVGSRFDSTLKQGTNVTPDAASIFVSIAAPEPTSDFHTIWRNNDGSINTHGFLEIKSDSKYASFGTNGSIMGAVFDESNTEVKPEVTPEPTVNPTEEPATPVPTVTPTETPATPVPTVEPTETPATPVPTVNPTEESATPEPTVKPTQTPETSAPTVKPVVKVAISKATVSKISNKVYTGKAIKPSITVKYNKTALKKGTDYTVSYKNNVKPGKATITIKGIGSYTGTKKVSFNIVPKKVTKLKASSKKAATVTVTFKQATGASGYQISYKTSKNGTYKVAGYTSKTTKTIKKLKSKKTIYVRVRAYKTIDGKKVYGSYSTVISIKVK